jgi:DNA-binding transcriptional regulator/RsmH inhibitor MraZ
VSWFIREKQGLLRRCQAVSVKLDSKGRIPIPSFLRKDYDLSSASLKLFCNPEESPEPLSIRLKKKEDK